MSAWILEYSGFEPASEGLREALCTLGNGYLATRGASPEMRAGEVHYPATYVAGVYNRLASTVAGETLEDESVVNLPNWLPLTFRGGRMLAGSGRAPRTASRAGSPSGSAHAVRTSPRRRRPRDRDHAAAHRLD